MKNGESGAVEIEHTADWELAVWASDLSGLFIEAARGMYRMMGAALRPGPRTTRKICIPGDDLESLLVGFLSELLFFGEQERLGFDEFQIHFRKESLSAEMTGAPFVKISKEIKAVTYHKLAVRSSDRGYEANVVFDV